MLLDDVKPNIMLNLNIDDLVNICQVDQSYYKICLDAQFWKLYFHQYQLPFPSQLPKTLTSWVDQFVSEYLLFNFSSFLYGALGDKNKEKSFPLLYQFYYILIGLAIDQTTATLHGIKKYLKFFDIYSFDFLNQCLENMTYAGYIVKFKNKYRLTPYYQKRIDKIQEFFAINFPI